MAVEASRLPPPHTPLSEYDGSAGNSMASTGIARPPPAQPPASPSASSKPSLMKASVWAAGWAFEAGFSDATKADHGTFAWKLPLLWDRGAPGVIGCKVLRNSLVSFLYNCPASLGVAGLRGVTGLLGPKPCAAGGGKGDPYVGATAYGVCSGERCGEAEDMRSFWKRGISNLRAMAGGCLPSRDTGCLDPLSAILMATICSIIPPEGLVIPKPGIGDGAGALPLGASLSHCRYCILAWTFFLLSASTTRSSF